MSADTEFNYVVGYPWDPADPEHLAIYAYHGQVHRGTQTDAAAFLSYVKSQNPNRPYRIYRVSYTLMEVT